MSWSFVAAEQLEPRRLMAAGDLDPNFGGGAGMIDVELTHPLLGAERIVPIPGGDFLVIGQEIRRFKPSGALDTTFGGGDGVIDIPPSAIASNTVIENAAVLPDGKVIAVERIDTGGGAAAPSRVVTIFNPDGSVSSTAVGPLDLPVKKFAFQDDGSVLAVTDSRIFRFDPAFTIDSNFGHVPLQSAAVDRAADGSFFAVGLNGQVPPRQVIAKLTPSGAIDGTFGSGGEVLVSGGTQEAVTDLAVDADGTLITVIGGKIRRLKLDGHFDSGFGDGGAASPTFGEIAPASPQLTPVPGGKILVIEGSGVTRLTSDGKIDPAYGRVVLNLSGVGVPAANQWGEVYFTSAGITQTLAIHRLAADNPTPGPIHLDENGQLFCIGTDNADEMHASRQGDDLVIMRNRFDVSRVCNPADVTLLNFQGLGGNDFITLASAGYFRTTVSGGDGNDKILGCDGPDSIGGNAGKDFISGGSGADRLAGHGGRDKLLGEGGNDRCYGGPSGDWLIGAGGNDQLYGDGGNDQIYGGSGADLLDAGQGDDLLISNDAAFSSPGYIDSLFGDGGHDRSVADPIDILSSIETKLTAAPE